MPSSIEDILSEEILDWVVSLCPRGALAALSLTSKKLNRIAVPHLYAEVVFDQKQKWGEPLMYLLRFTHLMFTSQYHASLVKSLVVPEPVGLEQEELDRGETAKSTAKPWPDAGSEELEKLLRKKCEEYALDEKEANELYEKIASGQNADAVFALLLVNLPNLQKLDLNAGECKNRPAMVAMLERVGQRVKPFDKIPTDLDDEDAIEKYTSTSTVGFSKPLDVMVKFNNDKYPEDPRHLGAFFNLPFLRSIHTFMTGDDTETSSDNPIDKSKPRSCGVEYIELRCSKIHNDNLKRLLDATIPGKLKTFYYEIGNTWAWCAVEHPTIMKTLEAHHDTLENLGLSHEDSYLYQSDNDAEQPFPVSFKPFKNLKRLKVAPVYIWGHDGFHLEEQLKQPGTKEMLWKALPSNLEEFWLHRAQQTEVCEKESKLDFVPDCLLPALELLVQKKEEAYPNLRDLRIEFKLHEWTTKWLTMLAAICDYAEENDIHCTIIFAGQPWHDYKSNVQRKWGWYEDVSFDAIEFNQEPAKVYVVAAEEKSVEKTLKKMKAEQEKKKKEKEKMDRNDLG